MVHKRAVRTCLVPGPCPDESRQLAVCGTLCNRQIVPTSKKTLITRRHGSLKNLPGSDLACLSPTPAPGVLDYRFIRAFGPARATSLGSLHLFPRMVSGTEGPLWPSRSVCFAWSDRLPQMTTHAWRSRLAISKSHGHYAGTHIINAFAVEHGSSGPPYGNVLHLEEPSPGVRSLLTPTFLSRYLALLTVLHVRGLRDWSTTLPLPVDCFKTLFCFWSSSTGCWNFLGSFSRIRHSSPVCCFRRAKESSLSESLNSMEMQCETARHSAVMCCRSDISRVKALATAAIMHVTLLLFVLIRKPGVPGDLTVPGFGDDQYLNHLRQPMSQPDVYSSLSPYASRTSPRPS